MLNWFIHLESIKLFLSISHIASANSFSDTTPSPFLSASTNSYSHISLFILAPPYEQKMSSKSSKEIYPSLFVSSIWKAALISSLFVIAFLLMQAVMNSWKSITPSPVWSHSLMTYAQLTSYICLSESCVIVSSSCLLIVPDLFLLIRMNSFWSVWSSSYVDDRPDINESTIF